MVLKVYGFTSSTATRCVTMVCKELHISYEMVPVDLLNREHKTPEFRKKHPFGQVPVIEDDGFVLYESRAICRYLAAKAGSSLLPKQSDLQTWAKFETACSIEFANFDPPTGGLIFEKVVKPKYFGTATDENAVTEFTKALERSLDAYEIILSTQQYLAGDDITLADLFHLPHGEVLSKLMGFNFTTPSRPNVARWWKDISSRPSWKSVIEDK